jgi:hypothetical protein
MRTLKPSEIKQAFIDLFILFIGCILLITLLLVLDARMGISMPIVADQIDFLNSCGTLLRLSVWQDRVKQFTCGNCGRRGAPQATR